MIEDNITKTLNNNIKFFIIYGVSLLSIIEFFVEVGYTITLLTENPPISMPDASQVISKALKKLGWVNTDASNILNFIS